MTRLNTNGSMLPPQRTNATRLPFSESNLPARNAASGAAPAPSTTPFSNSAKRRMASAMAFSSTATHSSTRVRAMSKLRAPTSGTARPSASVATDETRTGLPAAIAAAKLAHRDGSTPTIFTCGASSLVAKAIPAIKPAPPIGTTMASRSGTCSRISRPTVPCPATIAASLKPLMYVRRSSATNRSARLRASAMLSP